MGGVFEEVDEVSEGFEFEARVVDVPSMVGTWSHEALRRFRGRCAGEENGE